MSIYRYKSLISSITILILLHTIIGTQFLRVGLELDEGGFLAHGWRLLHTGRLYDVIGYKEKLKPPGIYIFVIPAVLLCGTSIIKIRIFCIIILFLTALGIYYLGKKISSARMGLTAAIIFSILVYHPFFAGYALLTELLFNFVVMLFLLILMLPSPPYKYLILGLLAGLGICIRQTGVYLLLLIGIFIYKENLVNTERKQFIGRFLTGLFLVIFFSFSFLIFGKGLSNFIDSQKSMLNSSFVKLYSIDALIKENFYYQSYLIAKLINFFSPLLPFILFGCINLLGKKENILNMWFLLSFIIMQLLPRVHPHHFLEILPPLAIISAIGIDEFFNMKFFKAFPLRTKVNFCQYLFIFIILPISIVYSTNIIDEINLVKQDGRVYPHRSYPGILSYNKQKKLSNLIKATIAQHERIWMFPIEGEIFFLSERMPSGKYAGFYLEDFLEMGEKKFEELILGNLKDKKVSLAVLYRQDYLHLGSVYLQRRKRMIELIEKEFSLWKTDEDFLIFKRK